MSEHPEDGGSPQTPPEPISISPSDALSSRAVVMAAAKAADEKMGDEIVALDVSALLSVVDYFVIVSGRNVRQVATLVEEIEEGTKSEADRGPLRIEGLRDASWVLMDYGDVIVHVFLDETRSYYDLEHLWSGAPRVDLSGVLTQKPQQLQEGLTQ